MEVADDKNDWGNGRSYAPPNQSGEGGRQGHVGSFLKVGPPIPSAKECGGRESWAATDYFSDSAIKNLQKREPE